MELFRLKRIKDISGISGTGYVAEGICFSDGSVVIRWTTNTPTFVIFDSIIDLVHIHGHDGSTIVEWI